MDIKEFAAKLGVSTTTVSSALTGRGRVGKGTQKRILEKAREFGYVPNVNARRLVTKRSYLISYTFDSYDMYSDMLSLQTAYVLMAAVRAHECELVLDPVYAGDDDYSLLRERILTGGIDGAAIMKDTPPVDMLREIAGPRQPCVVVCNKPIQGIPYVGSIVENNRPGVRMAAEMLVQSGHRHIGYIGCEMMADPIPDFFAEELATLGVKLDDDYLVNAARATPEDGSAALAQLMSLQKPPTAIFARTDALALGALQKATEMGIRIPLDLSLVGGDDLPIAAHTAPPLTTMHVDFALEARTAVEMLFRLRENPTGLMEPRIVDSSLVIRQSVGPAPRS